MDQKVQLLKAQVEYFGGAYDLFPIQCQNILSYKMQKEVV
jgi:hypothetical protein